METTIQLAGPTIAFSHRFSYVHDYCKEYLSSSSPDFTVSVSDEEILAEQEAGNNRYSLPYCESACICRAIARTLPLHDAFLLHASVIDVEGKGYGFAAKSGTGKTTHTRLWLEAFPGKVSVVNGDKPVIRLEKNRFIAYGSPWNGKERMGGNRSVPLGAICFLERGKTNRIMPCPETEALDRIIHQLVFPKDKDATARMMDLVSLFLEKTRFFILYCTPEKEAAEVACEGLLP